MPPCSPSPVTLYFELAKQPSLVEWQPFARSRRSTSRSCLRFSDSLALESAAAFPRLAVEFVAASRMLLWDPSLDPPHPVPPQPTEDRMTC